MFGWLGFVNIALPILVGRRLCLFGLRLFCRLPISRLLGRRFLGFHLCLGGLLVGRFRFLVGRLLG